MRCFLAHHPLVRSRATHPTTTKPSKIRCRVPGLPAHHVPVRSRATHPTGDDGLTSLATLLQEFRHQPGPAGLMTGANAGPVVAVEILVEKHQVSPVRVRLKLLGTAVYRPAIVFIRQENPGQTPREFCRDIPQRHHPAGASGKLYLVVVAQIVMELLQRLNEQVIDREPDGSAPVRVSAELRSKTPMLSRPRNPP